MMDEIWTQFDDDNSGDLDQEEAYKFMSSLVKNRVKANQSLDYEEFKKFFQKHDADGDGSLDRGEIETMLLGIIDDCEPSSKESLK